MRNAWDNDKLQFARLIAELDAAGAFTAEVLNDLCITMGLDTEKLRELIGRANTVFEKAVKVATAVKLSKPAFELLTRLAASPGKMVPKADVDILFAPPTRINLIDRGFVTLVAVPTEGYAVYYSLRWAGERALENAKVRA